MRRSRGFGRTGFGVTTRWRRATRERDGIDTIALGVPVSEPAEVPRLMAALLLPNGRIIGLLKPEPMTPAERLELCCGVPRSSRRAGKSSGQRASSI